jgi:hypothetical protein
VAHDQRRLLVSTTARSRALADAMAPHIESAYARLEVHLGADYVQALYAGLDALISRVAAVPALAPGPHKSGQKSGPGAKLPARSVAPRVNPEVRR